MEKINDVKDINIITNNTIMKSNFSMTNSNITFNGINNKLLIEDGVKIVNSKITFNGDNAECYISHTKNNVHICLTINNYCKFYIGSECYFNGILNVILSEMKNCIIGNDCLFSFGIWIRTADPHLLYDLNTKKRINPSKSILIGDHVWIGQNSLILKNTIIGSGSVIGANSVVASKTISSNSVWAGNPAKLIKENCFWSGHCVHTWKDEQTRKYEYMDTNAHDFTLPSNEMKRKFNIDSVDIFNMPNDRYRFSI